MDINFLEFLRDMFHSQNINHVFLAPPYDNISKIDAGLRQKLYSNFDYSGMLSQQIAQCLPNIMYMFQDSFKLNYIFFQFSDPIQKEEGYTYGSIGPILYQEISNIMFYDIVKATHLPPELHGELMEYYNSIPVFNLPSWDSMIILIGNYLFGGNGKIELCPCNHLLTPLIDCPEFHIEDSALAMRLIEERYELEESMLYAIQCGDSGKAYLLYNQFIQHKITPRTADPIRNKKNLTFVLNTLARKAVQKASVHPMHIDEISSRFAQKIENATNIAVLNTLSKELIHKYCNLVKTYSLKGYSPLIQKCINYIDFNYAEPLSLKVLADLFSVNSSYLSTLFKKEKQVTLTEYINGKRIHQSLILLNTTSLPIQDIAMQVGFSDINYFTRIFKKLRGMSPRDYRDAIQNHKDISLS